MPKNLSANEKLEIVLKSESMNEIEFSKLLRKQGIYSKHVEEWKRTMLGSLASNICKDKEKKYRNKIVKLEKELKEVNALIILQKKAQNLLKGEE